MDYSTLGTACQGDIDGLERLTDDRFCWRRRKMETLRLADIYQAAGYEGYAKRARDCSTCLQYNAMADGRKALQFANFCNLRLCPLCTARRARKVAYQLSRIMDLVQAEHGVCYIFLTLTILNMLGAELGAALEHLTASWRRLVDKQRQFKRSVRGWYRAIEITRNEDDGTYHPHIHAVLAVLPEYFKRESGLYMTHDELVARWRLAAQLDYDPSVDIRRTTDGGIDRRGKKLVLEAAKYATKSSDYISARMDMGTAVQVVTDYTQALWHRRMIAYGGWMKDAARAMGAENPEKDTDLVHIGDETIRSDVAELILDYHWNFGVGDYILASRRLSALQVVDLTTGEVVGPIGPDPDR